MNELQVVRTANRWLKKHSADLRAAREFQAADRSICPELWRAPELTSQMAWDEKSDLALCRIAQRYGISPAKLDEYMLAHDYAELDRWRWAQLG